MLIGNLRAIHKPTRKDPNLRKILARWVEFAQQAEWSDILDARRTFPTADAIVGTNLTCFNIGGNSFRLLAVVSYARQEITIHELISHAEYTRKYVR